MSDYVTLPNFVAIGQAVAEIWQFFLFFQDDGRSSYWICDARVWTTYDRYLVVFITAKFVAIDTVVSTVCNF